MSILQGARVSPVPGVYRGGAVMSRATGPHISTCTCATCQVRKAPEDRLRQTHVMLSADQREWLTLQARLTGRSHARIMRDALVDAGAPVALDDL